MIDITLKDTQTGYDAVAEYVRRYWNRNVVEDVVVCVGTSYDGINYCLHKEVVSPLDFNDVEFMHDWWEGERHIKIFGIQAVSEIAISESPEEYDKVDISLKHRFLGIIQDYINDAEHGFPHTHDDDVRKDVLSSLYDEVNSTLNDERDPFKEGYCDGHGQAIENVRYCLTDLLKNKGALSVDDINSICDGCSKIDYDYLNQ